MASSSKKPQNKARKKPNGLTLKVQGIKKNTSKSSAKSKASSPDRTIKSATNLKNKTTAKTKVKTAGQPLAKTTAKSNQKTSQKPKAKTSAKLKVKAVGKATAQAVAKSKVKTAAKTKDKSARKASSKAQRALVVGISSYPTPIDPLPAVAADVREMGKILRSKDGAFRTTGVSVLTDRAATRKEILASLRATLGGASADQTVFVYLAGHGGIEKGEYYFIAHDTDCGRMAETGVPLRQIKNLFDGSRSRRVFLWLDFCHSGGILVRGRRSPMPDDRFIIKRTIDVVQGQGKVIVAACSPVQSAYEDPLGHGLFTGALLRGLRGDASANGEVTSNSLYDFIDREIGSPQQRPMQFGHMSGRIVLMHYRDRSNVGAAQTKPSMIKAKKAAPKKKTPSVPKGTWVMLGRHYFLAQSVKSNKDGTISLVISPASGDEEANLANMRPGLYGGGSTLPYAWNNDAGSARVREVESEMAGGRHFWTITLAPQDGGSGGNFGDVSIETNGRRYTGEDIAKLRAGRILLNHPPEEPGKGHNYGTDGILESYIRGSSGRCEVRGSPIRQVYSEHGRSRNWKQFARLKAIFTLKASGTVDRILELTLGAVRAGKLSVKFRGRRSQSGSEKSSDMEIQGECPLG